MTILIFYPGGAGEYYSLSEFCRCLKQIALFFLPHYTTCRVARRSSVELRKWSRHDPKKNYDVVGSWLGGFLLGGYNRWNCRHSQQIALRMQQKKKERKETKVFKKLVPAAAQACLKYHTSCNSTAGTGTNSQQRKIALKIEMSC